MGSLLASLSFFVLRLVAPSDGAVVAFYADAWTFDGVRIDPLHSQPGGLRPGDVVVAIDGRPLGSWLDGVVASALDPSVPRNHPRSYTVERDGETVTVPVELARHDPTGTLVANWSVLLFTLVLQLVAAWALMRRPEASAAVALVVAACGVTGSTLPWLLGLQVSDLCAGWPFLLHALTAGGLYMLLWPAGALHLPLALSAGPRGPGRRALALAYGVPLGGYLAAFVVSRLVTSSSTAWVGSWATLQPLVIIPTVVGGLGLTARGFRTAGPAARRQLRWALVGGGFASFVGLLLFFAPQLVTGRPILPWSAVGLIALPLPLGMALAVVRHGLLDIEVVLNRSLVYGSLTLLIVGIYASVLATLGHVLAAQAGFQATLLATGIAAIVAQPARDFLQRTVNRLMYGHRDEPFVALARLGERLESSLQPDAVLPAIAAAVGSAVRAPYAAIELLRDGALGPAAATGVPTGQLLVLPLHHGADAIGRLLVAPRGPGETFGPADRRLLDDLARQASVAARAIGLAEDLRRARRRLVTAREEERRRLRRELRAGPERALAGLDERLVAARLALPREPERAQSLIEEGQRVTREAISDIRWVVRALRPPALDELGLVGAIRLGTAREGKVGEASVTVEAPEPLPELPAAVEVAAYRLALEAVADALSRIGTRHCRVRVEGENWLAVVISRDVRVDGQGAVERGGERGGERQGGGRGRLRGPADGGAPGGVAEDWPGSALLASLRNRAAELGGTVEVEHERGQARLVARLPVSVG
jgi:signal transduction histidine kinase